LVYTISIMKILIIEDEHKIANSIKKGFEQESFAVDVSYTADDGLDLALSDDYDAIILDRLLPGMDGVEICKKLRKENKHTPILLLTARGQIEDKVEGLNAGADDYMAKPFAFEELLARVKALTRRPKDSLGSTLKVENLTLNTVSYEVKRANKTINLTSKEFALLEYLIRNKGKILTKDQIINHVWNYDADILPNTVEVYIGYLRGKVDRTFGDQPTLIHTIRGFGYKIEESKRV
jgi:two-component system, OmpR family, response regulator